MSEKYQREIEDILGQIDELPAARAQPKRRNFLRSAFGMMARAMAGRGNRISPGKILLTSLALVLVAALFKAVLPGIVVPVLLWTAVITFIVGYALFFINTSEPFERRWRGEPVNEPPPTTWERMRRWLRGRD